jgi:hypothetical protein
VRRLSLNKRLIEPTKALWLYLCSRPTWVRVFLGPLLWIGLNVALVGCYALVPSDQTGSLWLLGFFVGAYGLGYLVGNWWAIAAPLLLMVGATVLLFVDVSDDPDFGLLLIGILLFAALLFFLIKVGIDRRQRGLRDGSTPKQA